MKKTLVAIAALTAVSAFAQSSVTVYGVLDAGYSDNKKTVGATEYGQKAVSFSNYTSSRVGFRGTEDLGSGMTANFVIETGIASNTTTGTNGYLPGTKSAPSNVLNTNSLAPTAGTTLDATSLGNRELNASVKLASGTIIGAGFGATGIRSTVLGYAADGGINVVGNTLVNDAQFSSNRATGISVAQPLAAGLVAGVGMTRQINTQTGVADNKNATGYLANLKYDNGPLSAAVAYQKSAGLKTALAVSAPASASNLGFAAVSASEATVKTTIAGASYALDMAKLFAEYGTVKTNDATTGIQAGEGKRSAYSLGAQFPMGAVVPFVQFSGGNKTESFLAANAGEKRKYTGSSVGVQYNLSKRTFAYGVVGQTKLAAGSNTTNFGSEVKNKETTFGLAHSF